MNTESMNEKHGNKLLRILKKSGIGLGYVIIFLSLLVATTISWMFRTWNGLTMNELMFHLNSPTTGTDSSIIVSYLLSCVLVSVIMTIGLVILYKKIKWKRDIILSAAALLFITMAVMSVRYMWGRLDISAYANNRGEMSTFIDDNYVDPASADILFPEQKRNLVYIFLESMENTYADEKNGGAFAQNVIPELTEISNANENFSGDHETLNGGVTMTSTTWTVAGMFAQTSGLPLLIPISANSMNSQEHFFPGLTTLGDILEEAGYNQYLTIGSDAAFGGRDLYFTDHGNYELYDYNYSARNGEIPEGYRVFWGYEDNRLFENAKAHLLEAASQEEPFNFTMLTVDTHFEDGWVCEDCPDTFGDDQYANVMACSSKKVADFIAWIQEQDFYENTTIVLSGDHLTMDSNFCQDVDENYERKVYTTYINADAKAAGSVYREYSTFDNFPTTLASLGVKIEGNRLGLGTNLFSSEATLLEKYDKETINNELQKKSEFIDKLTADIVVPEPEEETEEEAAEPIQAEVAVTDYDFRTGKFDVVVNNITPENSAQGVKCAVWSEEDQSNLKWYEAELQEDGSYIAKVWAGDFAYQRGEYQIHVYILDENGEPVLIEGTTGVI